MMVDASAWIAVLRQEADSRAVAEALEAAPRPLTCAATLLEAAMVAGPDRVGDLLDLVRASRTEIVAFGEPELQLAVEAHHRFGRGSGSRARLNFGDCIAYAAARSHGAPLLAKGDDFTHTDLDLAPLGHGGAGASTGGPPPGQTDVTRRP